ncbi:unnamed protein product [Hydatigera taeniaeformis]|uniref:RT_RNaseH_2 domain-containing protein n=1 Tax=Hydatigena taeniaeformis TaxID=6205 RepID=A0A0R3X569_HYDTA|nr:unnamed protein product [Hydatigera taeniaeformis]
MLGVETWKGLRTLGARDLVAHRKTAQFGRKHSHECLNEASPLLEAFLSPLFLGYSADGWSGTAFAVALTGDKTQVLCTRHSPLAKRNTSNLHIFPTLRGIGDFKSSIKKSEVVFVDSAQTPSSSPSPTQFSAFPPPCKCWPRPICARKYVEWERQMEFSNHSSGAGGTPVKQLRLRLETSERIVHTNSNVEFEHHDYYFT